MSVNDYLNNLVDPSLEAHADSMDRIQELEVVYEGMILEAKENWPPSCEVISEIRRKEVLIDSERSKLGLPLRFHTTQQLRIILDDENNDYYFGGETTLQRHYLPSSAAERLRFRFDKPHEMSMDPGSDELNVVESLWPTPASATQEEEEEEQEETVKSGGRTTITLGALIKQLQELQESVGKNAPVWHIEMGGITATKGAEEWKKGVVIA
jgi:hypothetical protein